MKKKLAAGLGMFAAAQWASAQSSLTLYGLLDTGISHYSNQGGQSKTMMGTGISVPSFWGVRGQEDLGGGRSVIFDFESQLALSTGGIIGNGVYARNTWVGISDAKLGTLKLGNQFDFMSDSLTMANLVPARFDSGLYNYPTGPAQFARLNMPNYGPAGGHWDWDRTAQEAVASAIKYNSPDWGGFKFGAMYGFGGKGQSAAASTVSLGLNYKSGNLGLGAAYTGLRPQPGADGALAAFRIWGVGAHYQFGKLLGIVNATSARNTVNSAAVWQASVGGSYAFDSAFSLGAAWTYMRGNEPLGKVHANQLSATLNYSLSKRTALYAGISYQRASGGANALINGAFSEGANPDVAAFASSSPTQTITRIGLRTAF